jgi:integrase
MATIRQRGDKWQVQIRRAGERPHSKSFYFRKDANAWARQMEVRADRMDLLPDPRRLKQFTLGSLVRRYQQEITIKKRGASVEHAVLSRFLLDPICALSLSDLRADHFAKYRDQRLKQIKPCSLKRQLNPIRHLFEVARHKWGLPIRDNPIALLGLKAPDQKRERRLRPGEYERLKAAACTYRNPLIKNMIDFAIATGMRRGEILAMKWPHIDFSERTLLIPLTKTGHARTIPLAGGAVRVLAEQSKNSEFVFPIKGEAFRLAWDRITRRAEIEDLRFHDLRHEAISRLFEIGLTTPEVASISGHRDARMLFRYAHAERKIILQKFDRQPAASA